MPRVKQSKPKRVDTGVTSVDEAAVPPDAVVFAPGEDAPAPDAALAGKVGPKKVRVPKVKPCVRCEERRAREREYAKSSRLRLRLAASSAPPASPEEGAAGASSQQSGGAAEAAAAPAP